MPKRYISSISPWILAAWFLAALTVPALLFPSQPAAAATTSVIIKKLAPDGNTVTAQKTVDYHWLMSNLPVMGDGSTRYYHQGPVFVDDADKDREQALRWNPAEDTNIETKDMGAVKGTNVKDLCSLVGGMGPADTLKIKARDGLVKSFAYKNVYQYSPREGPMVLCWYKDGQYPDSGYSEGMRLVWLADTSVNPWGLHVFGNWDWHEAAEPRYWYFYQSGGERYPTTTGLSIQNVSELIIVSGPPGPSGPQAPAAAFSADITSGPCPLTVKFTDQSANSPVSWAWDFDADGQVDSREANPTFTYQEEGIYTVKLSVQNAAGTDTQVKADYIRVSAAPAPAAPAGTAADVTPGKSSPGNGSAAEDSLETSSRLPLLLAAAAILGAGTAYAVATRRRGR